MPLKKGPKGTLRYYNSANGRYCSSPFKITKNSSVKRSKLEKEMDRRKQIYLQASNSKDKHLFDIYLMLEKINPGCVQHIYCMCYDKNTRKPRELDIITDKKIYEIKSGKARHKFKQYFAQIALAKSLNKEHVVFSPESSDYQVLTARKLGINIFNKYYDFKDFERRK